MVVTIPFGNKEQIITPLQCLVNRKSYQTTPTRSQIVTLARRQTFRNRIIVDIFADDLQFRLTSYHMVIERLLPLEFGNTCQMDPF